MAGHHSDPAFAAKMAIRSRHNYESMVAFAIAMACFAGLFVLFHLVHLATANNSAPSFFVTISRKLRRHYLLKVSRLPPFSHVYAILFYIVLNLVVTFTNMDNEIMNFHSNIASRTGWMTIGNLLILVVLALKNTPLGVLAGLSYERLNLFHRVAGYVTVTFAIVHGSTYASYFMTHGNPAKLTELKNIYGMIAGGAFLMMGISGGIIRRWWYELFYFIHVTCWMLAIVMVGLHQPALGKKIIYITLVAAGLWSLDRLIRFVRLVVYSTNNTATLTPLPNGGTRVTLAKPPLGARPGEHCFLWIPSVRLCEAHPFTVAATQPLEFVVASHDGFTCDLHEAAVRRAGEPLRASVEGGYGSFPDGLQRDKVVLIAGGSGATFAVGAALNLLKKMGDQTKVIEFIWVIRDQSFVPWFAEHLRTLTNDPRVNVRVFVTRSSTTSLASTASVPAAPAPPVVVPSLPTSEDTDPEKAVTTKVPKLSIPATETVIDEGKLSPITPPSLADSAEFPNGLPVTYKRPDVHGIVQTIIRETPKDQSVLVMSCGPVGLMTAVRNATAQSIQTDGPSVELHCETFGW